MYIYIYIYIYIHIFRCCQPRFVTDVLAKTKFRCQKIFDRLHRGWVGLVAPCAFGIERDNLLLNGADGPPAPPLLPRCLFPARVCAALT